MARKVFTSSDGDEYGIEQVSYNPEDGNYYLPGSSSPLTVSNATESRQAKFASEQDDFVASRTTDGDATGTGGVSDNVNVDGRPSKGSSSEPVEGGEGGPPAQATTSQYATGNGTPALIQQRLDQAMDNNGLTQAKHEPTKLTDDQGNPLPDDQEPAPELKISEPLTAYNAQYPYNQVKDTESGHVLEMDDTPGSERVSLTHRTGTFIEMHPDGSQVDKVMNERHSYTDGDKIERVQGDTFVTYDKSVTIKTTEGTVTFQLESGSMNITLNEGNFNLHLVGGNLNMKVDGNINEEISGNVTRKIGGNLIEQVAGDVTRETTGNVQNTTSGTTTDNTAGDYTVTGATINLN
jgi:hypothetical protein